LNLVSGALAAGEKQSCNELYGFDAKAGYCEKARSGQQPYIDKFPDGTFMVNPKEVKKLFKDPEKNKSIIAELSKENPKNLEKIKAELEKLKLLQKARLMHGRQISQLNEVEVEMLHRIDKLNLIVLSPKSQLCDSPTNSGYVSGSTFIGICPIMANYPAASMVGLLAHESAHTLDACSLGTYEFKQEVIDRVKAGDNSQIKKCFDSFEKMDKADRKKSADVLIQFIQVGFSGIPPVDVSIDSKVYESTDEINRFMAKCELMRPPVVTRSNISSYPYTNINNCAEKAQSELTHKKVEDSRDENVVKQPYCQSTARECFADSLGAQLTDDYSYKYLKGKKAAQISDSTMGAMVNILCDYDANDPRQKMYASPSRRIDTYAQFSNSENYLNCKASSSPPICSITEIKGESKALSITPQKAIQDP
jgi:hypothetical protein